MGLTGPTLAEIGGWPFVLGRLMKREDLTGEQASAALSEILQGNAEDAQIAAFALGLRMKGETVEEIAALVRTMLDFAEPVITPYDVIDTCGTGGDRSGSINVSTLAAFVVAGAGVKVCKHGNRAASSMCGSADLLEALGVKIDLGPEGVARCIEEAGIGFCFAPRYHPASRFAIPARKAMGVPTVFNFLGPLANPARPKRQVVGVSDPAMADKMLGVLRANGAERAMVVYGHDGLDELTTTSSSTILELVDGTIRETIVQPGDLGVGPSSPEQLAGGTVNESADKARQLLGGTVGPHADIVALNAAAALVVAGRAADLAEALEIARAVLADGRAARVLEAFVASSAADAGSAPG